MSGKSTTTKLEAILGFELSDIPGGASQLENESFAVTAGLMQQYTVPQPSPLDTARLLSAVRAHVSLPPKTRFRSSLVSAASSPQLLDIIRPQICLLRAPFWVGSAVVVLLGVFLTSQLPQAELVPLLLLAPLMAALGVAYAFRNVDERVLELEMTCPMSWPQLSLARLIIILGYDSALLLLASFLTARFLPQSSLFQLIISWMAPLLIWATISLFTSLRFGYYVGVMSSFGTWVGQILIGITFPQLNLWSISHTTLGLVVRVGLIVASIGLLTYSLAQLARSSCWAKFHLENN